MVNAPASAVGMIAAVALPAAAVRLVAFLAAGRVPAAVQTVVAPVSGASPVLLPSAAAVP